jgi:hypothetical protein
MLTGGKLAAQEVILFSAPYERGIEFLKLHAYADARFVSVHSRQKTCHRTRMPGTKL